MIIAAAAAAAAQHDETVNFCKTVQRNQRNLHEPAHDQRVNVKTKKCIDMSASKTVVLSVSRDKPGDGKRVEGSSLAQAGVVIQESD